MLEIAFQNQRQHRQLHYENGSLRLARDCGPFLWHAVGRSDQTEADAFLEISTNEKGIVLATEGCEIQDGDRAPARFAIGDTWFEIRASSGTSAVPPRKLERLHREDRVPRKIAAMPIEPSNAMGPSADTISRWFAALGTLNRWSSSLQELYVHAARTAVEAIGLDGAMLLRRRDDAWDVAASYLPRPELGILCEPGMLDELLATPETVFHGATDDEPEPSAGDRPPSAVVVSPLCDSKGTLTGAIYGYRSVREGNSRRGIRYLEANLIELLANVVSEGMSRLEQQAAAERRRVLLEHSLAVGSPPHNHRFVSEQREVTLLFADLRDFSRLSTTLETEQVFELLSHVMDSLTAAVMEHDGLVIDYFGDGLAAMWNAPADQTDHGELACRAALRMLEQLPAIDADWAELLEARLRLGIGIHTGGVQVGNAGSATQIKYGPRGANVHIANRVEAATKLVGVPLLVTDAVASRLSNRLMVYRVCRGALSGIHRAVDLYSVVSPREGSPASEEIQAYEAALELFEGGRMEQAAFELSKIDAASPLPADFLREQIEREMGCRQQRRSTDRTIRRSNGVVGLRVK